jgi:prepilin-type N-terminal cleavage/methylation domain-containing protein
MPTSRYNDRGDTLIEIIIAVVLIGLIFSAFTTMIAMSSTGSATHRNLVTADALLRSSAEATKAAARAQCNSANAGTGTFVASYPTSVTPSALKCPALNAVSQVDLTATLPNTPTRVLSIDVRAP